MQPSFQRTCCVCRQKKHKNELIRIVKNKQNTVLIDRVQKLEGRGAYVCKNEACIIKCEKSKALNRAFKCEVSKDIYSELHNIDCF